MNKDLSIADRFASMLALQQEYRETCDRVDFIDVGYASIQVRASDFVELVKLGTIKDATKSRMTDTQYGLRASGTVKGIRVVALARYTEQSIFDVIKWDDPEGAQL
jgi:hypothetical protein